MTDPCPRRKRLTISRPQLQSQKVALRHNESPDMKRVRVAPGKFVTVCTELSEKAAGVFATGLTRDQVRDLKASESRRATGLMAGSAKPLALARLKTVMS